MIASFRFQLQKLRAGSECQIESAKLPDAGVCVCPMLSAGCIMRLKVGGGKIDLILRQS